MASSGPRAAEITAGTERDRHRQTDRQREREREGQREEEETGAPSIANRRWIQQQRTGRHGDNTEPQEERRKQRELIRTEHHLTHRQVKNIYDNDNN